MYLIGPWPWCLLLPHQSPLKYNLGPLKNSFIYKSYQFSFAFTKHPSEKLSEKGLGPWELSKLRNSQKDTSLASSFLPISAFQVSWIHYSENQPGPLRALQDFKWICYPHLLKLRRSLFLPSSQMLPDDLSKMKLGALSYTKRLLALLS